MIAGQLALAVSVMGPRRPRWSNLLPLVSGAVVAAHLLLEGGRWQMVPAYLVVAALCTSGLLRWAQPPREIGAVGRAAARIGAGLGFLLLLASALALTFLPATFAL